MSASRFSGRVPGDLRPNALTRARRARGSLRYDLTVSNPTACGIDYPPGMLAPLSASEGLTYTPEPRGLEAARRAVAGTYAVHGLEIDPRRVVLVSSTSEAYAYLFKLLCDPGDTVLIPSPSYPLFEHLAALEGIDARAYRLDPAGDWQPEPIVPVSPPPRALIAVHPNNPTGSLLLPESADRLVDFCSRNDAALIVDEVFGDYPLEPATPVPSFAADNRTLTFALGGLSKSLGLPQLKLAWIVVAGPEGAAAEAIERLEFIADNYLSVATPVQRSLATLLSDGAQVREAILERCRANLSALRAAVIEVPQVSLLEPRAGWSAVLRYPSLFDEETLALRLLEEHGVAVHPGYFFDFPAEGFLVLSLLAERGRFREGTRRILTTISGGLQ